MCSRNSRSCRLSRSVSVSSEARSIRNCLTSADTDVSRSAAAMRARRYVSSSSETVMFLMNSQLCARTALSRIALRVAVLDWPAMALECRNLSHTWSHVLSWCSFRASIWRIPIYLPREDKCEPVHTNRDGMRCLNDAVRSKCPIPAGFQGGVDETKSRSRYFFHSGGYRTFLPVLSPGGGRGQIGLQRQHQRSQFSDLVRRGGAEKIQRSGLDPAFLLVRRGGQVLHCRYRDRTRLRDGLLGGGDESLVSAVVPAQCRGAEGGLGGGREGRCRQAQDRSRARLYRGDRDLLPRQRQDRPPHARRRL